jgi:hypothetical protein
MMPLWEAIMKKKALNFRNPWQINALAGGGLKNIAF